MFDWSNPEQRLYHHGLDRGVLYKTSADAVPWLGLVSFDEDTEGGTTEMYYRDGEVYMTSIDPGDFRGQLTAMMYPDEFGECVGMPETAPGLYVDNQRPKSFSLSYRTLVGSGSRGDLFGHQIHLVYNCLATIGTRNRRTVGSETTPMQFTFDVTCTPVKLPGYRPTAHYVIDTRGLDKDLVSSIERILYGVSMAEAGITEPITEPILEEADARLPTPQELYDLMHGV